MKTLFVYMVFVMLLSGAPQILAQQRPKPKAQESGVMDLRALSGKPVAEGRNKTPFGPLKLLTYKLEEVTLPQSVEVEIRGEKKRFLNVLRLTIMSASDLDAHLIWIDDASLTGVWGVGGKGVATLIYDRSILRSGAVISLSQGGHTYELAETLSLPESVKATVKAVAIEEGNTYTIRTALRITDKARRPLIEIEFRSHRPFPVLNAGYGVQIGKNFFPAGAARNVAGVSLTPKEFAELKDGAPMVVSTGWVNFGAMGSGVWYFGPLDKSRLDR